MKKYIVVGRDTKRVTIQGKEVILAKGVIVEVNEKDPYFRVLIGLGYLKEHTQEPKAEPKELEKEEPKAAAPSKKKTKPKNEKE